MNIRIGSVKAGDEGEYIGRATGGRQASPLANPYPITSGQDPADVIAKYRVWLWGKIKAKDQAVLGELSRLLGMALRPEGVILVCWCRSTEEEWPPCHGDVVKAVLEWLADGPLIVAAVHLGAALAQVGK